ncbi:hypothetical protein QSJ18_18295 [Gordonia sp. ABSL1-1]|uniref:hypothetical protein n=1 Tax=Gordonia sp. ABSL1-1 TaxID=3053923 RepID=UPI002573FF93|nr:hypothetical protein [Gordonia sp. ABSL1-1]MDL9938701.1 hypothetical protein [Gordonia sp. ABSL1-1]
MTFPYPRPPLTSNQRLHHMTKARITKQVRQQAYALAKIARIADIGPCVVVGTWVVKDCRRRDVANWDPTMKAILDGLTDAGVWADDDSSTVTEVRYRIRHVRDATPHITVELLPAYGATCFVCGSTDDRPHGCGPDCIEGES